MKNPLFNRSIRSAGLVLSLLVFFAGTAVVFGASLTDIHFLSGAQDEIVSDNANQFDITSTSTTGGAINIRTRDTGNGLYIDTANHIGIGNTSPGAYALSVTGSTTVAGDLVVTGGSFIGALSGTFSGTTPAASVTTGTFGSNAAYRFNNSGGSVLLYTDATNSRVGIGTATPAATLDIAGLTATPGAMRYATGGDALGATNDQWRTIATVNFSAAAYSYDSMSGVIQIDYPSNNAIYFHLYIRGNNSLVTDAPTMTYSFDYQGATKTFYSGGDPFRVVKTADVNGGAKTYEIQYSPQSASYGKVSWQVWYTDTGADAAIAVNTTSVTGGTPLASTNTKFNGGFYFPSGGAVDFAGGATFPGSGIWNTSGNVGIGTASPGASLQIGASSAGIGYVRINPNGGWNEYYNTETYPRVVLSRDGGGAGVSALQFGGGSTAVDSTLQRTTNGAGMALIGGNVGVGTTTPAVQFHVYSASAPILAVSDNTDSSMFQMTTNTGNEAVLAVTGNHPLRIYTNGSERMRVAANGSVGIGNGAPTNALDVTGSSTISGNLTVSGTITGTLSGSYSGTVPASSVTTGTFGSNAAYRFNNSGGSVLLYTDATNSRVGIGTATPARTLDVTGAIRTSNGQLYSGSSLGVYTDASGAQTASFGGLLIGTSYDTTPAANQIRTSANQNLTLNARGTGVLVFSTADAEKMRIANNGSVGIGTTGPAQKLEVNGQTGLPATSGTTQNGVFRLSFTHNGVLDFGMDGSSPYGSWLQSTDDTSLGVYYPLLLNPRGGNVGIGTTSPGAKLEVNGDIKYSKNYIQKVAFTPTTIGRYRIFLGNNTNAGTIEIDGNYDNRDTKIIVDYYVGAYGVGGNLQQRVYSTYNGGVIDRMYVGYDNVNNKGYIDVNIYSATTPSTLTVYLSSNLPGASLVASPVVGATAIVDYGYIDLAPGLVTTGYGKFGNNVVVNGSVTATSFSGTYSGTIGAASVTSGTFGSNAAYRFNDAAGNPLLYTDATNGRVGIGLTGPAHKLQVTGSIHTTAAEAGGGGNLASDTYDLAGYTTGVQTLYSYGAICAGNSAGSCGGSSGVTISAAGLVGTPAVAILASGNSYFNGGNVTIGASSAATGKLDIKQGTGAGVGWATALNIYDGSNRFGIIEDGVITRFRNEAGGGYQFANGAGSAYPLILDNSGNATFTGAVTATSFSGNGSGLTNVTGTDSSKVAKTGDTMSGVLTIGDYVTGARLNVGSVSVDYPANAGWSSTYNANIVLSGLDSTSIGFHDSSDSVGVIRYTNNNFYIGESGSWGTSNLTVGGTVTASQFNGSGAGLSSASVPIASLAAGDYSGKITSGIYSITGAGGGLRFGAGNWSDGGTTYGHIETDNTTYKALMIVGNNIAGNSGLSREVKVWDFLNVQGNLNATTAIRTGSGAGTVRIDSSGNLTNIGSIGMSSTLDTAGGLYNRSNINILNKAGSAWLAFATRDTGGAEAAYDLAYIDKLDANTVDPPYTIDGKKYATYVSGMTGVKEETSGVFALKDGKYIIDFADAKEGSDLWLFAKVANLASEGLGRVTVLLTPNFDGKVWYEKDGTRIIISSSKKTGEVSYRLTAPRFDHEGSQFVKDGVETYGNLRKDGEGVGEGFNLNLLLK